MKVAVALFAGVLLLAGCESKGHTDGGLKADPTATATTTTDAPKGVMVEIEFVNGEVVPLNDVVDVKLGEPINLHVISDVEEEIHVHSDPEHEYEVAAGDDATFTFTIDTPGQFAVEAHDLEVTIVELVVRP
ncbi:MAG: hypothetical protein ABIN55_00040 [Aeromicrobium sp.]